MDGDDVTDDDLIHDRCPTCPVVIGRELDAAHGRPDRFAQFMVESFGREPCRGPVQLLHPSGATIECNGHVNVVPIMPLSEWVDVVMDETDVT